VQLCGCTAKVAQLILGWKYLVALCPVQAISSLRMSLLLLGVAAGSRHGKKWQGMQRARIVGLAISGNIGKY
jgi:hypothetical protein